MAAESCRDVSSSPSLSPFLALIIPRRRTQALEMCPAVQDAVARLCCAWWAAGGPDKEELLSQTLPFLLVGGSRARTG